MASSLIVEVCKIKDVRHHENSDNLDLAIVKGWQVVVGRDQFKEGDLVVYIPMDALIPTELADEWGIRNYLGGHNKDYVRCARLRGEMSYGLIIENKYGWIEGKDASLDYGIKKYIPPMRVTSADAAPRDIMMPTFTDVENINNFPESFVEGEEVIVTEKIDGTNCRIGFEVTNEITDEEGIRTVKLKELKAGSMSYKRTMPHLWDLPSNPYWFPWTSPNIVNMMKYYYRIIEAQLKDSSIENRNVTLFGETYGGSIRGGHKSMDYGTPDHFGFAAYGVKIDDEFIDWDNFFSTCARFKVAVVPVIEQCPFNMDKLKTLAMGSSFLAADNDKQQIKEGIVVYPVKERRNPELGRCILKMLNPDYLILKEKNRDKGEEVDFKDE